MLEEFHPLTSVDMPGWTKTVTNHFIEHKLIFNNFIPLAMDDFCKWIQHPDAWMCFKKCSKSMSEYIDIRKIKILVGKNKLYCQAISDSVGGYLLDYVEYNGLMFLINQ